MVEYQQFNPLHLVLRCFRWNANRRKPNPYGLFGLTLKEKQSGWISLKWLDFTQMIHLEDFANVVEGVRPQQGASFGSKAAPLLIYPAVGGAIPFH